MERGRYREEGGGRGQGLERRGETGRWEVLVEGEGRRKDVRVCVKVKEGGGNEERERKKRRVKGTKEEEWDVSC